MVLVVVMVLVVMVLVVMVVWCGVDKISPNGSPDDNLTSLLTPSQNRQMATLNSAELISTVNHDHVSLTIHLLLQTGATI